MDSLRFLAVGLSVLGMVASALGVAAVFSAMLNGIARNPETEEKDSKSMFILALRW